MQHIEGEIVFQRPVEEVFDFVADERHEPQYNPQMLRVDQISSGPIGRGTQFHCEMGRNVEMVWEITAYERPRRLGGAGRAVVRLITALPTMDMQGTLTFDPVPGGTRMRWSWQLEPCGVFKLLTPLIGRVGQRQEATIWASLKQLLERQETPLPSLLDGGTPMQSRRARVVLVAVDAFAAVLAAAYALFVRPWQLHWGATHSEMQRTLPGDDLVPHPLMETTRALTIRAPVEDVWPWLVQIGYDRAGFYSYAWLENLIGLDITNADRIVPAFQKLELGDHIMLGPDAPLRVAMMQPRKFLIMYRLQHPITGRAIDPATTRPSTYFAWSWAFVLDQIDAGTTRLIVRARGEYRPRWLAPAIYLALEPIHFVMERKMLLGIKERAGRPHAG